MSLTPLKEDMDFFSTTQNSHFHLILFFQPSQPQWKEDCSLNIAYLPSVHSKDFVIGDTVSGKSKFPFLPTYLLQSYITISSTTYSPT